MSKASIKRLLLVEDNPGDARLLREMFKEHGSHNTEVTHVESMGEAERQLPEGAFDIILLDLGLPDAQGLVAVRRAHAAAPRVPLVVLTGLDDESLAVQALQEGAQDYLVKGQIETRGLMRALRYAIERKVIEAALFVEKERLRLQSAALESTADGVMITERDGSITWVNPAFSRITGFSAEEAIGRKPSILRSGQHNDALYGELWRTILDGQVWDGELTNKRKDGHLYLEAQTITPVRDARGGISHFVSVTRDISHRRRLEEQFRQSQKMEAVGRLSGGVAHDFNNLLAVILGFGDMLLRCLPPDPRFERYCGEILKAANRGAGLTRQLLAFSRQQTLQPKVIDLNAVVSESEKMLGRLLGEDVELVTSLDPDLGNVKIDPGEMEQVIMNLAVNARDAMPRGGTLTMETANLEHTEASAGQYGYPVAMGSYVRLTVTDTGIGMDEATRAHIFEPFFTTKDLGKGTGLGLATVYGVVEQSKGHISVESKLGRGSRFTILLPRLAARVTPVGEEPREDAAVLHGTETVLLAEDDDAARGLWREMLETLGYRVLEASNGPAAIEMVRAYAGRIDLLLTDVVMPRMGGGELSERMVETHPDIRVIFMSGYTADTILRQGIAETGRPFLQKPFTAQQFARKIRETLDAKPAARASDLQTGTLLTLS
jgi:two-component system cell cycle sensor histidine kinase/response regulator CckA